MLDHECVRKLTARWGSRFGASRSAMRSTPPRLGAWASAGESASRTVASSVNAHRAAAGRGLMSYLLGTMRTILDRTTPERRNPKRALIMLRAVSLSIHSPRQAPAAHWASAVKPGGQEPAPVVVAEIRPVVLE